MSGTSGERPVPAGSEANPAVGFTGELGLIGDRIIFENEAIRVWALQLDPGGRQPWHRHDLPYLIVPISDGHNRMTFADGRVRETHEVTGEVIWREAGIPHELVNISSWNYRNILIEFKSGATTAAARP